MKRLIVLIACASLVVACHKNQPEDPGATPEPAASQPAASPEPQPDDAAEAPPVEITDEMVTKYMDYEKENVRILEDYVEKARKDLEGARGDTMKTLQQITVNEQFSKELDEKLDAKRRSLGLSESELATVKDAAQMTATARLLYQQMGGDAQLAAMEAEQKKSVEALPEDQRAAAAAEADKMMKGIKDLRDGSDMRKKYGDRSADAVLRHADALAQQRLAVLNMMSKSR